MQIEKEGGDVSGGDERQTLRGPIKIQLVGGLSEEAKFPPGRRLWSGAELSRQGLNRFLKTLPLLIGWGIFLIFQNKGGGQIPFFSLFEKGGEWWGRSGKYRGGARKSGFFLNFVRAPPVSFKNIFSLDGVFF